jgi:hypothetical protein
MKLYNDLLNKCYGVTKNFKEDVKLVFDLGDVCNGDDILYYGYDSVQGKIVGVKPRIVEYSYNREFNDHFLICDCNGWGTDIETVVNTYSQNRELIKLLNFMFKNNCFEIVDFE